MAKFTNDDVTRRQIIDVVDRFSEQTITKYWWQYANVTQIANMPEVFSIYHNNPTITSSKITSANQTIATNHTSITHTKSYTLLLASEKYKFSELVLKTRETGGVITNTLINEMSNNVINRANDYFTRSFFVNYSSHSTVATSDTTGASPDYLPREIGFPKFHTTPSDTATNTFTVSSSLTGSAITNLLETSVSAIQKIGRNPEDYILIMGNTKYNNLLRDFFEQSHISSSARLMNPVNYLQDDWNRISVKFTYKGLTIINIPNLLLPNSNAQTVHEDIDINHNLLLFPKSPNNDEWRLFHSPTRVVFSEPDSDEVARDPYVSIEMDVCAIANHHASKIVVGLYSII